MSFRPEDETEIKPGMTFHFMPGLWLEDWGIEITESIEISEIGANALPTVRANIGEKSDKGRIII